GDGCQVHTRVGGPHLHFSEPTARIRFLPSHSRLTLRPARCCACFGACRLRGLPARRPYLPEKRNLRPQHRLRLTPTSGRSLRRIACNGTEKKTSESRASMCGSPGGC